jgi:hypothetical protein
MIAENIITHLEKLLPSLMSEFSDSYVITSITHSAGVVTVTTQTAHNRTTGDSVTIAGVYSPLVISSLTRNFMTGTLITAENHDCTLKVPGSVVLANAANANFNGSFPVTEVVNRKTINFSMTPSGATVGGGSPLLINGSSIFQNYNGRFVITVTGPTTFTYALPGANLQPGVGTMRMHAGVRVSGSISLERAIEAYTQKSTNQYWGFVVLEDVNASKNRSIQSDFTDTLHKTNYYRQQIGEQFSFYVFIPASGEIAGRAAMDNCRRMFPNICRALVGVKFDSFLYGKTSPIHFISHGIGAFNPAFYVNRYTFESVTELNFENTAGYSPDVAFRDIHIEQFNNEGTEPASADINLDSEALS